VLEPTILGKRNRREPRNRLEFATLLTVQSDWGANEGQTGSGDGSGLALLAHTAGNRCRQVCDHLDADSVGGTSITFYE
jgi:hypothetical protein